VVVVVIPAAVVVVEPAPQAAKSSVRTNAIGKSRRMIRRG
jgi:hypothetical protein